MIALIDLLEPPDAFLQTQCASMSVIYLGRIVRIHDMDQYHCGYLLKFPYLPSIPIIYISIYHYLHKYCIKALCSPLIRYTGILFSSSPPYQPLTMNKARRMLLQAAQIPSSIAFRKNEHAKQTIFLFSCTTCASNTVLTHSSISSLFRNI